MFSGHASRTEAFAAADPCVRFPAAGEQLRQLRLDFKVAPAEVTEIYDEQMTARELLQVNVHGKARAVVKKLPSVQQKGRLLLSRPLQISCHLRLGRVRPAT